MAFIDVTTYQKLAGIYGKTNRDKKVEDMVGNYNRNLANTIDIFDMLVASDRASEVEINGVVNKVVINYFIKPSSYEVSATDSKVSDQSIKVWAARNTMHIGDVVKIINDKDRTKYKYYITVSLDDGANQHNYDEAYCQECNYVLKWKDKDGVVVSEPCYINKFGRTNDDFKVNKVTSLPDGALEMFIRNYTPTSWFDKDNGFRFMIGRKSSYVMVGINDASKQGLMHIILKEVQNDPRDDKDNMIADNTDYYKEKEVGDDTGGYHF